jgi:hypothetical protein
MGELREHDSKLLLTKITDMPLAASDVTGLGYRAQGPAGRGGWLAAGAHRTGSLRLFNTPSSLWLRAVLRMVRPQWSAAPNACSQATVHQAGLDCSVAGEASAHPFASELERQGITIDDLDLRLRRLHLNC